jgi:alkanesulfonate monooxygenase SsuD/methylene tetrahydromethanopterin reductase-like flavin-dependent oxidoreductase (luciferase family)
MSSTAANRLRAAASMISEKPMSTPHALGDRPLLRVHGVDYRRGSVPLQLAAHLPLIQFDESPVTRGRILGTVAAAERLGLWGISANDHVIFSRPWIDGPTALAMAIPQSGELRLCTTVALPTIRGPLPLAKTLMSLDALAGGRLIAGLGPGSSTRDYTAVGVPFEERWRRFDEAVEILRRVFRGEEPADGEHYATSSVAGELQPRPESPIPIWIGSWGSEAGLRRVARLADGWLASGYNTTPEEFGAARSRLGEELERRGRRADLPNGLATMWLRITEDRSEAERVLADVLGPAVKREPEYLSPRVCVGSADHCLDLLARYAEAGLERVFLWPLGDEANQLELVAERVMPALA